MYDIKTISTPFVLNVNVNCYLVRTGDSFILIDSGTPGKRAVIERELEEAGCTPGSLRLIALTHGDFDHCGNAACFARKFGAKIALHEDDTGMVEQGDMFWNRKPPGFLIKMIAGVLFRLDKANRFKPDFYIREGDTLANYGFDASVIELPGHSKGSVGFLTAGGDLFCGDLLAGVGKPDVWSIIDDRTAATVSVAKLMRLSVTTVYPGHGQPFRFEQFLQTRSQPAITQVETA